MSALSIKTVCIINSVLSCVAYLFHNKIGNTITINQESSVYLYRNIYLDCIIWPILVITVCVYLAS